MRHPAPVLTALLGLLPLSAAHAQLSLSDWHTVDGGGGRSESATFSLDGTIGQTDAGFFSLWSADGVPGGTPPTWELTGGFWAGLPTIQAEPSVSCGGDLDCIFRDGFES